MERESEGGNEAWMDGCKVLRSRSSDRAWRGITCFTVILPGTVILTGTIGVEPQFIKYDDSDSDIKNIKYLLCDVSRS